MKRSEINAVLREMDAICREQRYYLLPFFRFTWRKWYTSPFAAQ